MMLEWRNDVGMTGISDFSFFLPLQKSPHSTVIPSFQHHSAMPQMKRDENYNGGGFIQESFQSFILHSNQSCHSRMTEWGGMKGDFWTKAKPLILKITSFHCHSVIPCHYCVLHMVIPFIWGPFLSFEGHSSFPCHSNSRSMKKFIPSPRYIAFASIFFNMLLSLLKRQHHIKSFRPHSTPFKLIPISFETEKQWSNWNDCRMIRNGVWMI